MLPDHVREKLKQSELIEPRKGFGCSKDRIKHIDEVILQAKLDNPELFVDDALPDFLKSKNRKPVATA